MVLFPLVYALLPNKSETTYDRFFSLLKGAVIDGQSVLAQEYWMLDFEIAARNSIENNFPETSLKGCFFRYTQCIWRNVRSCSLAVTFKEEDFHKLVRRAAVLPLVPEHLYDNDSDG
jgi:hypothetical protein